jgi:hypothetical protein
MALPGETKFAWGWKIRPTFDEAVDQVEKPLRIPLPNRKAKTIVDSFYRNKILANERLAMGYEPGHVEPNDPLSHEALMDQIHEDAMAHQIGRMEHQASKDTVPAAVLEVQPSPSADDVIWKEIMERTKQHFEDQRQAAIRHRVDEEAKRQLEGERFGALYDAYSQGRGNPSIQGEAPLKEQFKTHLQESPAYGHYYREVVPKVVPKQPPLTAGYTAHHEFTPFRELNYQEAALGGKKTGVNFKKQGDSYETFRRVIGRAQENIW